MIDFFGLPHLCKKQVSLFLLFSFFLVFQIPAQVYSHPATDDEFVGPFASWVNVQTQYGTIGDGIADETTKLQNAFNAIGNATSTAGVVYLPAGTYRITNTLTINYKINVSIIGADPATTKIIWDGPVGGTMMQVNGTAYSRFNRISWDGDNKAAIAIDQSWDATQAYFDTGNEYADNFFSDVGIGIRGGFLGYGFAETAIMRCRFIRNSVAGISLGNFNALDVWIWHSLFEDCAVGVTNANTTSSAGNFKIYKSVFKNSTISDVVIGNTGEFSLRDNTSFNSQAFVKAIFKNYPANITLQANVILDPVADTAISIRNQGPVVMLDNIIRSRPAATSPVVIHTSIPTSEFFSMGNTFTISNAIQSTGRNIMYDEPVVTNSSLQHLSVPVLPGTQPPLNRQVFEVAPGSNSAAIQAILNQAASFTGNRPIVHFAHGTYNIQSTLIISAGSDLQITGDGYDTWLNWVGAMNDTVLLIMGPGKVTFRDISINGFGNANILSANNIDQQGARFFMHQVEGHLNENGLLVDGLDHTEVRAINSRFSGNSQKAIQVIGGPLATSGNPQGGKTIMFGGLEWDNALSHEVSNGGHLLIRDVWYESTNNGPYLHLANTGTFTVEGSSIASPRNTAVPIIGIENFAGRATFINTFMQDRMRVSGNGSQTKLLGLGILFNDNSLPIQSPSISYIENNTAPAGDIRSFNSRSHNNPNLATPRSGSYAVNDIGIADSSFLATMIEPIRSVHAEVLTPLPNGITDVRLYRVSIYRGKRGIELKGNGMPITFTYVFTGTGNWNTPANWQNNIMPPSSLPAGEEIIIDPTGGTCILNIPQTISAGAKISVAAGKLFEINGMMTVQ